MRPVTSIFTKMKKITLVRARPVVYRKKGSDTGGRSIGIRAMLTRKCLLLLYGIFIGIFIYITYGHRLIGGKTEVIFSGVSRREQMACHLPKLNPFDESILKYSNQVFQDLNCAKGLPEIFSTNLNSTLLTVKNPKKFGLENCCYRPFTRANENKFKSSSMCYPINETRTEVSPEHEFIAVECNESGKKEPKIVDMFGLTPLKSDVEKRIKKLKRKNNFGDQVNVVIFGLDGVSDMNFIRTMPESYKYLTQNLSAIGMKGYNKVGDNTFPNVVPALTGLSESELISKCWATTDVQFDNCPLIWKNFSNQGYRTNFAEDATWMGAFNYQKHGFLHPPTDYYLRTLTHAQANHIGHDKPGNAELCYGPRLGFEVLLKNVKNLAAVMGKTRRYFQFTWATSLSHDYLSAPTLGDRHLLSTLKWLKNDGYLNQTVLILTSDHGIRWGGIRTTFQGKVEERMPLLYFVFPDWFSKKFPDAVRNLEANVDRLTSPFDLYATLLDLMTLRNLKSEVVTWRAWKLQNASNSMPRGTSLFLPVPLSRTCPLAGIDDHWCVCHTMEPISTSEDIVEASAAVVVSDLNNLLKDNYPNCAQLTLKEITSAQSVQFKNTENALNITTNSVISVMLSTTPGNAVFEATLMKLTDQPWTISGDISRLNLYGEQSHCVSDYKLKKYCYCVI